MRRPALAMLLRASSLRVQHRLRPSRLLCSAPAPAPAAAPAPAPAPSPAPAAPAAAADRLLSTDIAFKPTENGWGYSKQFSNNWDNIFGGKKKKQAAPAAATPAAAPAAAAAPAPAERAARLALLQKALDGGALSPQLFERAVLELEDE